MCKMYAIESIGLLSFRILMKIKDRNQRAVTKIKVESVTRDNEKYFIASLIVASLMVAMLIIAPIYLSTFQFPI